MMTRTRLHGFRLALPLAAALLAGGCDGATGAGRTRTLPGSADSLEELGRTVWAALLAGDTARLERVRLSEHEHNERVWPKLPAADPEVNFPVDLAWENIQRHNRAALAQLLPYFAQRSPALDGTECRGETRRFEGFHVRTDCSLLLRGEAGDVVARQVFKDVLVMNGEFKIFHYYAD